MSYEAILEMICEHSMFEKLTHYVGNACFDPGEFGEIG